jgi:YbbR domain-containing protein
MRRFLTENIGWKLLSVLLAFCLWIAVAREPEMSTSMTVPVLFRNMPGDLDFASEAPERVHLEVRGPAGRLTAESLAQTAVMFDLSGLQPGERTFNIQNRNIRQLPFGVFFNRAIPSQVSLRLERLVSKEVPIEPSYGRAPQEGYIVTNYTFDPPKVRIKGPESRVKIMDHVITDPIDVSGVVSQASKQTQIRVQDPQVRLESSSLVQFIVTTQKISHKDGQ